jgi:D-arabinose 1-dehydrogenase-like Zn-dependent alcohol dehydrogenase
MISSSSRLGLRAMLFRSQAPIGTSPLEPVEIAMPIHEPGAICVRVGACATCRTDLRHALTDADRALQALAGDRVEGTAVLMLD